MSSTNAASQPHAGAKPALVNGLKDEIAARTDKEVERMQAIMDQKKPPLAESVGKLGDGKAEWLYGRPEGRDSCQGQRRGLRLRGHGHRR